MPCAIPAVFQQLTVARQLETIFIYLRLFFFLDPHVCLHLKNKDGRSSPIVFDNMLIYFIGAKRESTCTSKTCSTEVIPRRICTNAGRRRRTATCGINQCQVKNLFFKHLCMHESIYWAI